VYHRRLVQTVLRAMGADAVVESEDVADAGDDATVFGLAICTDAEGGPAFVRRVREGKTGLSRQVLLLVLCDEPNGDAGAQLLRAGADGLLAKPVSAKKLYGAIQALFADAA